ncbi:hypothetical protein HGA13_25855 [Nocardia speluncae]|uniref:Uncharacterized protein n=1 Tax=Nocardia speluncae TaxID=419477 RepID=A0A846XLL0_9NOCA|nr:hypothetical protein [Nocardia speluncae]NKY36467.1 hypothetical protein [Nocardia speluncae]
MSEPNAGDPGALAARLAALPDEQLLAVLVVATAGREELASLYEVATRLLSETGRADPAVIAPPAPAGIPTGGEVGSVSQPGGIGTLAGSGTATAGYTGAGMPTFDSVRDKVQRRIGTAFGHRELDRNSAAGRGVEEQWEAREQAARERLEQIRTSLHEGDRR